MSRARYYAASGALLLLAALGLRELPQVPSFVVGVLSGVALGLLFVALVKGIRGDGCDEVTPAQRRKYLREFVPPMFGYVIAVFLSVWLLRRVDAPVLRALIALLPVPAIALAMRAIVRRIRDADELQRRIELEALSIAAACVSLGYFSAGFLQLAKVIDVPSSDAMIWVFPLTGMVFGVAKTLLRRRYA
jgi:hypothetical protein